MPERLRNVRRSMVLPSMPDTERVKRRGGGLSVLDALRVSIGKPLSDPGRAVVVADVLGQLIATLRLAVLVRDGSSLRMLLEDQGRRGRCRASRCREKEAAP